MKNGSHTLNRATLEKFQTWLRYLHISRNTPQNMQMLFHYYFDTFALSPNLFYLFLRYFSDHLEDSKNQNRQKVLAEKYLAILSPLCARFNFYEERNRLDDLCFKIVDPATYDEMKKIFAKYEKKSRQTIGDVMKRLNELLQKGKYDYELSGRYKNIYSIYGKIKKRTKDALKINDIFGFRIILNSNSAKDCFAVLNLLHDTFHPLPDLFKDYITIPKINGYQSLHTGLGHVVDTLDMPVEVQIRTREMHEFAEKGLAAHWIYAREKKARLLPKKEKRLLNYIAQIGNFSQTKDSIYCFTYKGDIVGIPKNSTLLDFAYMIHTDLGHRFHRALVNQKEKPLSYRLKEGDQIEIIPADEVQIQKKWLQYASTRYAHKKIADYLKIHAKKNHT